jgi:excisionase family DNA binding protein
LALGPASRLLGVDPDTLRRWADEGRVPAFTTPGGHRRFERRALERLVAARRTGPKGELAALGDSTTRLSAAFRRRYGELQDSHGGLRSLVPVSERAAFRETGQRLVDAMARNLDASGPARGRTEREAMDCAAELGARLACDGIPLEAGVSMFVAARRPFLAELSVLARRQGVDALRVGQLYDASTSLLDRLLLAFVAAYGCLQDDTELETTARSDGAIDLQLDPRGSGTGQTGSAGRDTGTGRPARPANVADQRPGSRNLDH